MKKMLYLLILLMVIMIPNEVLALNEVNVYFFHKSSCDICKQESVYLEALKKRYPNMRIYSYDINDENNYNLMKQARNLFDDTRLGVPYTVIADTPFHGFSQGIKGRMQKTVYEASINPYTNKLGKVLNIEYKNDLEGTVEEYKDNASYTIEEKGEEGNHPKYKEYSTTFKKYQASIILISAGLVLLIIYLILKIHERRRYR